MSCGPCQPVCDVVLRECFVTQPNHISCVHFVPEILLERGGVVQAVVDLCQAIAARGHRVTLVTCDASDEPVPWKDSAGNWPTVVELPSSRLTNKLISRRGLQTFREIVQGVDVAHLHIPWRLTNVQLSGVLQKENVPYVLTTHGMLDDWSMRQSPLKKRVYLTLARARLFRHAAAIHFTAKGEYEQAERWISIGDRGVIQCNTLDLTVYDPLPGSELALQAFPQIHPEKKKILFLSRLHPKKGVELLLGAAALLREQRSDFQLLIAGPGEEHYVAQLQQMAVRLGVSDLTCFLGMVKGTEKRSLYQSSDVFVLPTHQENFGLVLVEAMVCGTPVVTTRGTDIWPELQEAGALIAELTPAAIAAAIGEILAEDDGGIQRGAQGQAYVLQWLNRDHVLEGYEKIYRKIIEKNLKSRRTSQATER